MGKRLILIGLLVWTINLVWGSSALGDSSPCLSVHAERGGSYEIVVRYPDGKEKVLTRGSGRANNPSATLDGRLLTFDQDGDIFQVSPDGTGLRRLTEDRAMNACPVLAGRGRWLAYQSNRDGQFEVYLVDLASGLSRNVTRNPANDACPALSPDGTRLAFVSDREGTMQIYLMELGSGSIRRLTDQGENMDPAFSPDGKQIAFVGNRDGNFELYLMEVDGSHQRRLTLNETADLQPAFAPDGSSIYVERGGSIYRLRLDGNGEERVISGQTYVGGPALFPCPDRSAR
jgi:TolB protein